jgi:hypothetical protein
MDPNQPPQPNEPPPQWSAPEPPQPNEPPQWGAPLPSAPAGAPPELDTITPPAWTPPPASSGGRAKYVVIAVFVAVVLIAGLVVGLGQILDNPAGNVYFSKSAYDQGSNTCKFDSPVTTFSTSDSIYLIAAFNDTLQPQDTYTLEIFQDGVSRGTTNATADAKFNCYIEKTAMGPLSAGVYRFTFKHNDKIEAEGTLTVK